VAADGVRQELTGLLAGPGEPATHVLVADPSYGATYADLDAAFRALRAGAELVATQVNRVAARDDGEHLDTGGWVRLLEYATGQRARVLGKPSPAFFTAPGRAPTPSRTRSSTAWPTCPDCSRTEWWTRPHAAGCSCSGCAGGRGHPSR
jgi:hypothetical protein